MPFIADQEMPCVSPPGALFRPGQVFIIAQYVFTQETLKPSFQQLLSPLINAPGRGPDLPEKLLVAPCSRAAGFLTKVRPHFKNCYFIYIL